MKLLSGTEIARDIRINLSDRIRKSGISPTLAIMVSGNNPASRIYVDRKLKACEEVGIRAFRHDVGGEFEGILGEIRKFNADDSLDAYLLQLPLAGLRPEDFFSHFDPSKDVDVFHPENVGLLVQGRPRFYPCTPRAIQVLLHRSGITVSGKKVVVINRSNVVGRPLSSMLLHECDLYANATVVVCHDRTPPEILKSFTRMADIIVVAVGKPGFLTADMVSPGQVVIDVGINRLDGKIVGDADCDNVCKIVESISPVPGGVGPLTVAMLLENCFAAACKRRGIVPE